MGIVLTLTKEPFVLIRISLNVHGTRAVQKLIESLRKREEIHLAALRPGFLELIKDPSGNHVVQKCLQSFGSNNNKDAMPCPLLHVVLAGAGTWRQAGKQARLHRSKGMAASRVRGDVDKQGQGARRPCLASSTYSSSSMICSSLLSSA